MPVTVLSAAMPSNQPSHEVRSAALANDGSKVTASAVAA